ncbi:lanthionine synthetase c family protein, putative [Bodo saltans]|uniref:Lanthionine synthetase c family protein, putative n=1 Tax=Bodo saltans TaxID=75058 RepID=A0A0S4JL33_BODSA|nr:lanthionine synthetase c family protein, putative [Bodo saltans]|eukprot:CUG90877.1 lanthionine synthetase c family protein, putative [Bodo saltans]
MIPSRTSGTSSTNSSAATNNNISGDQAFQMRCGALLAFAACVRLTDGHVQNVIRTPDDFPVLIDGETVLTPQPGSIAPDRCAPDDLVLLTGLIEDLRESKKDGKVLNGATSAFQTKYVSKTFRPVIIADGTN